MRKRLRYSVSELHRMWVSGMSYADIAAALGCSQATVHDLKQRHKLPPRRKRLRAGYEVDPTPEQIAERAAECIAKRNIPPVVIQRVEAKEYFWDGRAFVGIS